MGALVADLAAAVWRTGRARRLELRAFAGDEPDQPRLELALRYHGSALRELHRTLRALDLLRRRPLTSAPSPDQAEPAVPSVPAGRPPAGARGGQPEPALPPVADLAWGGGGQPPIPLGCCMLRPVPDRPPGDWADCQDEAFPGAEPVPVAAGGAVAQSPGAAQEPGPAPRHDPGQPGGRHAVPARPPAAGTRAGAPTRESAGNPCPR